MLDCNHPRKEEKTTLEIMAYILAPFIASGAIYYIAKPVLDSIWNGILTLLGKSGALGVCFTAVFILGALIGVTFPDFYDYGSYRGYTLGALYIAWRVLLWLLFWLYQYLYGLWKGK